MEQNFEEVSNEMESLKINQQKIILSGQKCFQGSAIRNDGSFNPRTCGSLDETKLQKLVLKFNHLQQLYDKGQILKYKYQGNLMKHRDDSEYKKMRIQELCILKEAKSSLYELLLAEDVNLNAYANYSNNVSQQFIQFKNIEPQLKEKDKKERPEKLKNEKKEQKVKISKTKKISKDKQTNSSESEQRISDENV